MKLKTVTYWLTTTFVALILGISGGKDSLLTQAKCDEPFTKLDLLTRHVDAHGSVRSGE